MYVLIEDDDLLEKYNNIWDKDSADTKKGGVNTNFFGDNIKNFSGWIFIFQD